MMAITDFEALEVSLKRQLSHRPDVPDQLYMSHNLADYVDNLTGDAFPQNAYDY